MQTPFTKMVGAGNDFIVLDNRSGSLAADRRKLFAGWCDRRMSVGADGVLLVELSDDAHFRMRYYNADGGEAEMCGNGGRCIARYAYLNGIAPASMEFVSAAGRHEAQIVGCDVRLGMTEPFGLELEVALQLANERRTVHLLNTGVPHAAIVVGDVRRTDVVALGREIRHHERFSPAGINTNFVTPLDRRTFHIRTYERGVEDETLACGTGATASAIVGAITGLFDPPVTAITASGLPLVIHFSLADSGASNVFLEGPAAVAFDGILV